MDAKNVSPKLKKILIYLIAHPYNACPRWWVRWFVNPLTIKRGAGSRIRSSARLDIFPYNKLVMGRRSTIESRACINNGVGDVIIGNNSRIGIGSTVIGPVVIGNDVRLAQNIVISGLNHNYEDVDRLIHEQGVSRSLVTVGDDVWIGANSVITAGVTIGKHSVVAAGSVVTRSLPEYCVAAGSPAKVLKYYDFQDKQWKRVTK